MVKAASVLMVVLILGILALTVMLGNRLIERDIARCEQLGAVPVKTLDDRFVCVKEIK